MGSIAGWSQRAKTLLRGPQAQHLDSETERLPVVQNTCWYSDPKLRQKSYYRGSPSPTLKTFEVSGGLAVTKDAMKLRLL